MIGVALEGVVASWLLGSVPTAYLAGRAHGVDLRRHGSGNLGATNAWRVLGWKTGLSVYLCDTLKGALPVLVIPALAQVSRQSWWPLVFGIAAIVGHVRPIFLMGQGGGKGVATAGGMFLALVPGPLLVSFVAFLAVLLTSGFVSLGSLTAAAVLPLAILLLRGTRTPAFWASLVVATFVFWTHRANIGRLRRGKESRFGKRLRRPPAQESSP